MTTNIELINNANVDWGCSLSDDTIVSIRDVLASKVASVEVNDDDMDDAEYDSDKLLQTACDIASRACDTRKSVMRMFKDNPCESMHYYEQFLDLEDVAVQAVYKMNSKFYRETV